MSTVNLQQVRCIAIAGYDGACECQILYGDGFQSKTDYKTFSDSEPIAWDLASEEIVPPDTQFQLHSKRHDQHIHSGPYVYDPNGGLLIGAIVDKQAHFHGLQIL